MPIKSSKTQGSIMTDIILVGNPNTGKTTLFNTMTDSNNHVGNWHGVTVDISSKNFTAGGQNFRLLDLPGIYSLDPYSAEEKVATDYLEANRGKLVVNICDANNLARNLLLTLQLMERGHNIILAVNMANDNKNINYAGLSKVFGVSVVPIDARKKKGIVPLLQVVVQNAAAQNSQTQKKSDAGENGKIQYNLPYLPMLNGSQNDNAVRYHYIDKILASVSTAHSNVPYGTSKLDKLFYNKFLALPIFLLVIFAMFAITFGAIGQNLSQLVGFIFDFFADKINSLLLNLNISAWAHSLLMQGVVGGVGVVVSFLPQVVLLYLCMNFLEDVGYLSRVAFMFDGVLKKVGLSGKSVLSILLGYGCTTTAMLSTRGLDNPKARRRTALVLPFASCNAKMPIYALICSAFFVEHKVLIVFGLYLLGASVGLGVSAISARIRPTNTPFMLEIPPLRLPTISKTLKNLWTNTKNFISRVGGTLVLCSVMVWVATNLTFSLKFAQNADDSIISTLAKSISFIFKPLGFSSSGAVVALLVGLVAKEMIVSCLAITNGVVGSLSALATSLTLTTSAVWFTPASAMSFLVFVLFYSPCFSALAVTAKEFGRGFALKVFAFQFAIAYACAFVTYRISLLLFAGKIFEAILIILLLATFVWFVVRCICKKNIFKCSSCKEHTCEKFCKQRKHKVS